jgi:hypothetical protein
MNFLNRLPSPATRNTYGQSLHAFCEWSGKSPEELLKVREAEEKQGYEMIDLIQEFLASGTYKDGRRGFEGKTVRVAETSAGRRRLMYAAVRSFFAHHRAALPADKTFKISDNGRVRQTQYMELDKARGIIGALKEPYRSLYNIALYSGMGQGELMALNEMWPQLRRQLREGKDPIRVDFSRRKTNENPYFTFIPARLLKVYEDETENPFRVLTKHERERRPRAIVGHDLEVAWKYARKRAGFSKEGYRGHHLRDLFITLGYKVGVSKESTDFMTGHVVDRYNYLQLSREPDKVLAEWSKIQGFLDSGMTATVEQARKHAIIDFARLQGVPEEKLREIEKMVSQTVTADQMARQVRDLMTLKAKAWIDQPSPSSAQERPRARRRKRKGGARGRTAYNGGMPFFETRIVADEEELLSLLNEGWDILKELSGGKVVVRRPNEAE